MSLFDDRLYMYFNMADLYREIEDIDRERVIDHFIEVFNEQGIFFDLKDCTVDYIDDFPYSSMKQVQMKIYHWVTNRREL